MDYIKSIELNKNKNNVNGVLQIDDSKIFYKVLNKDEYMHELNGYKYMKKYYKTPEHLFAFISKEKGFIGYEYLENKTLLLDFFIHNNRINEQYTKLFDIYKEVFKQTIKQKKPLNSVLLFENRIDGRLKYNYDYILKNKLDNIEVIYNDEKIKVDIATIYNNVRDFFKSNKKRVCVVSQCDPNDLNICLDGTMFDFTSGGYVPLMGEFATFFWYNFGQAEYLSIKYNKQAFRKYDISRFETEINEDNIQYKPRLIRQEVLSNYISLINEVMNFYNDRVLFNNWFYEFKNYLAMKVLAVFDFKEMEEKDIKFSLAFISKVYNSDYKKVSELENLYK